MSRASRRHPFETRLFLQPIRNPVFSSKPGFYHRLGSCIGPTRCWPRRAQKPVFSEENGLAHGSKLVLGGIPRRTLRNSSETALRFLHHWMTATYCARYHLLTPWNGRRN